MNRFETVLHMLYSLGLPAPDVGIMVSSTAGLAKEECLGLQLETSDSVACRAGVVPNLFHLPNISIWSKETWLTSDSTNILYYPLSVEDLLDAQFTCSVCVEVPESHIDNYCSNKTVTTSGNS